MIEKINHKNGLIAIILSHKFSEPGVHFITDDDLTQQLAFMNHPQGKIIEPHLHNPVRREVDYTQEVLYIIKGKLRVDFFTEEQTYLQSRVIMAGDVILLASGGHGFTMLEPTEMIEVKQGPYVGESDKTRFQSKLPDKLNYGETE
jgi:mannose-6-phosphate isomerase-like protein (cupin superfamily)